MSFWDTQPDQKSTATAAPAPSKGSFWDSMGALPSPTASPSNSGKPQQNATPSVGEGSPVTPADYREYQHAGYGASTSQDSSGKPLLTYANEKTQSSQLLSDRVATTFDPTKPQKLDASHLQNGRMPDSASSKIKDQMGGLYSDELDHKIALELSGSNDKSNLQIQPGRQGGAASATDKMENSLAKQVQNGELSLLDAQRELARAKGYSLKEDGSMKADTPGFFGSLADKYASFGNDLKNSSKQTFSNFFHDPTGVPGFTSITKAGDEFSHGLKDTIGNLGKAAADVVTSFKGEGRPAPEKVANLAKLIAASANTAFSPITGAFQIAKAIPGFKEAADIVGLPFQLAGKAGEFTVDKAVDILPISSQAKEVLRAPLDSLGALAAQVGVGETFLKGETVKRVVPELADRIEAGETITPEVAKAAIEKAVADVKASIPETSQTPPPAPKEIALNPEAGFVNPSAVADQFKEAIDAWKEASDSSKAREQLRTTFTGNRDVRIAETNQLRDQIAKTVKAPLDQEALYLMRDVPEARLREALTSENPDIQRIRPAIERALSPSDEMKSAADKMTGYFESRLKQGNDAGFLNSSIKSSEYMTHLLTQEEDAPMKGTGSGKMSKTFKFGKERVFPTILDAIEAGKKPATINALDAMTIHGERFGVAEAANNLAKNVVENGIGQFTSRADAPEGWVPFSKTGTSAFRKTVELPEGGSAEQELYVPKKFADAFKPITEPSSLDTVPGFKANRTYQAYLKAAELALSPFHMKALTLSAIANMGPENVPKLLASDMATPEFLSVERDAIRNGMTSPVLGRTIEAYRSLSKSSVTEPTRMDMLKDVPGIKQARQAADAISRATFDVMQRKFKVTDYSLKTAKFIAEHPDATPIEVGAAKRAIAKEVNGVYGGLQWENMGINRTTQRVLQTLLLAPDWTFSNFANGKYFFQRGPAGFASRMFWARSAVVGVVLSELTSKFMSGHFSKNPTQVYYGKDKNGKDIQSNLFFAGAPSDLVNLVKNSMDFGPVTGPAKSLGAKASPFIRTGMGLTTNKDYQGNDIAVKGATPAVNAARSASYIGQNTLPLPFSVTGPLQMYFNKDQGYTLPEYVTTALTGARTSHTIPSGMQKATSGKNKGTLVPVKPKTPRPFLEQVLTGKVSEPATKTKTPKLR